VLWRAAPGCIGCHRCAHLLQDLGFLHEITCPDDLLIFLPPQAQRKTISSFVAQRKKEEEEEEKGLTVGAQV